MSQQTAAAVNIPPNAYVIALDYGSSTTSAAFVKNGEVQVIEFNNGQVFVSSDIALPAKDPAAVGNQHNYPDAVQVGAARGRACQYPDAMVTQNKLFLGSMYDDDVVQNKIKAGAVTPLAANPATKKTVIKLPNGDVYRLEDVMGYVVEYVLNRVREKLGVVNEQDAPPLYVQCAVPAQFANDAAYLKALAKGVKLGGGHCLPNVVPEPTAAAVAEFDAMARREAAAAAATTTTTTSTTTTTTPQQHKMDEHARPLVMDIGGGTCDIAVFQVGRRNELKALPQNHDGIAIGGNDYTNAIAHYLIAKMDKTNIAHPYNVDVLFAKKTSAEQRLWEELLANVENAKCEIKQQTAAVDVQIPLSGGDYTMVNLTAHEFATATEDLTNKCLAKVRGLLKKCDLSTTDITHVILTGGGANVVSIQDAVREMFNHKGAHFSIGQYGVPLQESVVRGAALLAAQYATRTEQKDTMVNQRPQVVDEFTPGPAAVLSLVRRVVVVIGQDAAQDTHKVVQKLTDESNKALQWWWYDLPKICVDSTCGGVMALWRGLMALMSFVMSLLTFCFLLCLSYVLPAAVMSTISKSIIIGEWSVLKFVDVEAIVKQMGNTPHDTVWQQNVIGLVIGACFAIYFGRAIWTKLIKWTEELAREEDVLKSEEIAKLRQLVAQRC